MSAIIFLSVLCVVKCVNSLDLPDYMPKCSRNDPELNACALSAARASILEFSQGDESRGWHILDPMYVAEFTVYIGPKQGGIKLLFKENNFTGLSELQLSNMEFDLDKKQILAEGLVNLACSSVYDLSGRILTLPITGTGDASIRLLNTTMHIRYWYEHVTGDDGKVHWKILRNELKYEVGKAIFRLDNLLGADKRFGDQINKLLNEVSREIVADLGPGISNALSTPVMENVQLLLDQVAFDDFMPETL